MFQIAKHLRESGEAFAANWLIGLLAGLLATVPVAGSLALANWQALVGKSQAQGTPAELAGLLQLEALSERVQPGFLLLVLTVLLSGVASFLGLIGLFIALGSSILLFFLSGACGFALGLMADRVSLSFLAALRATGALAKKHPVDLFKLFAATGAVALAGALACGLGLLISLPVSAGALYLAGRHAKVELETTAAAAGIELR